MQRQAIDCAAAVFKTTQISNSTRTQLLSAQLSSCAHDDPPLAGGGAKLGNCNSRLPEAGELAAEHWVVRGERVLDCQLNRLALGGVVARLVQYARG